MRKAALITGWIAVSFSALAIFLKLIDFPGGSVLLLTGTALFVLVFSPLLLAYQLKQAPVQLKKLADICGMLVALTLGTGLLGLALGWPATLLVMVGMVFTAGFIGLFFASLGKTTGAKPFGTFTVIVLVFYVALGAGWIKEGNRQEEIDRKMNNLFFMQDNIQRVVARNAELIQPYLEDGITSGADILHEKTGRTVRQIEQMQAELVSASNGFETNMEQGFYIRHPLDFDTPTMIMVGIDPAVPTGRATELYALLTGYRDHLPAGVTLDIDLTEQINGEPWSRANFYHVKMADAVSLLIGMKKAVIEAENTALEKGIFVNE